MQEEAKCYENLEIKANIYYQIIFGKRLTKSYQNAALDPM